MDGDNKVARSLQPSENKMTLDISYRCLAPATVAATASKHAPRYAAEGPTDDPYARRTIAERVFPMIEVFFVNKCRACLL